MIDYIELDWDGWTDWHAVRGWVSDADALAALAEHDITPEEPVVRQCWARHSCEGWSEHDHTLILYWASGPGRFPVTVVWEARTWRWRLPEYLDDFAREQGAKRCRVCRQWRGHRMDCPHGPDRLRVTVSGEP